MSVKRQYILPYKMGSRSTVALSKAISALIIRRTGSKYRPKDRDSIINWGNIKPLNEFDFHQKGGVLPEIQVLNPPEKVAFCSNKQKFFLSQKGHGNQEVIPRFWTKADDIPDDAFPIVCRTVLAGHSGAGIVIADSRDDLVPAKLFVEYKKKADEYRIHLGKDGAGSSSIITCQRKGRKLEVANDDINWQVRTHNNGFVYVRENVNPPDCVIEAARRVFDKTGLDFGAIDVVFNASAGRAWVLEVNTAPGLEGSTVTDYAAYFIERRSRENNAPNA